jgi:hypothetical protein
MSSTKKEKDKNIDELLLSGLTNLQEMNGHRIVLKQYNESFCLESPIFRYLRLSYLIDSIVNKRLFVPSMKQFSDLIEKNGCKKYKKTQSFCYEPSHKDKLLFKRQEKEFDSILSMCVKSWTLDRRVDGSIGESMLMWKTFAANEIVCRIETTIQSIIDSIVSINGDIVFADVNYGRHVNLNVYEQSLFNKTIHYDQEQEIRMLYLVENIRGTTLGINPLTMIKSITISPFIPHHTASFIISQLRAITKEKPGIDMHISSINEYDGELPNYIKDVRVWK